MDQLLTLEERDPPGAVSGPGQEDRFEGMMRPSMVSMCAVGGTWSIWTEEKNGLRCKICTWKDLQR